MLFQRKTITLKNGKSAILRNPRVEDAKELLQCIIQACGETDNLARYPEEWNMTVEQEETWIQRINESSSTLSILCQVDGVIAGSCEIRFLGNMKTAHRATIAISLLQNFWGLGIGTAMFSELIEAAKKHGTEILELEFVEGNQRAQKLYERMGFKVISERPNMHKLKAGSYRKEIYLQKYL